MRFRHLVASATGLVTVAALTAPVAGYASPATPDGGGTASTNRSSSASAAAGVPSEAAANGGGSEAAPDAGSEATAETTAPDAGSSAAPAPSHAPTSSVTPTPSDPQTASVTPTPTTNPRPDTGVQAAAPVPPGAAQAIADRYARVGGAGGVLGAPAGDVTGASWHGVAGAFRDYAHGTIYWTAGTGARESYGGIHTRYQNVGGPDSWLGLPTTGVGSAGVAGALTQSFQHGAIWTSSATGAHILAGPTLARYRAMGGATSLLGLPTYGTHDAPVAGAEAAWFQHGRIYWSPSTKAHAVHGLILKRWLSFGGPTSALGLPTTGVRVTGVPGAWVSRFQHGAIYTSPSTKARIMMGPILRRYLAMGGPKSLLGLPTWGTHDASVKGAQAAWFQRGRIYWSPSTEAHAVHGPILRRYVAYGAEKSRLGLPTTGVRATAVRNAWVSRFQGGAIYTHPDTLARILYGPMLTRYRKLGGVKSVLGLPTWGTHDISVPGAKAAYFQHGRMYNSSAGGYEVYGKILAKYLSLGGPKSWLGLPVTGTYSVSGGRKNRFRHGGLVWKRSTGHVTVTAPYFTRLRTVTASDLPYTYRPGCPVPPSRLRRLTVVYKGFDGDAHIGDIIVVNGRNDDIARVFGRAYNNGFQVRRIRTMDYYHGNDERAMAADNTSAFNCRHVTGNPYRLSQHSYGNAIDINTFENPYVTASKVYPPGSETYLNRRNVRRGMIVRGGPVANGMAAEGWYWGARWAHPDYQHFSSNGG